MLCYLILFCFFLFFSSFFFFFLYNYINVCAVINHTRIRTYKFKCSHDQRGWKFWNILRRASYQRIPQFWRESHFLVKLKAEKLISSPFPLRHYQLSFKQVAQNSFEKAQSEWVIISMNLVSCLPPSSLYFQSPLPFNSLHISITTLNYSLPY